MKQKTHTYTAKLIWDGNTGKGTMSYAAYERSYHATIMGKSDLQGSADPAFRGDPARHNPEDLFLTAISACHMLFYLSLCARKNVCVVDYQDTIQGRLLIHENGGGQFDSVFLHPIVIIQDEQNLVLAHQLHEKAHELCFIANSCNKFIRVSPDIRVKRSH